LNLDHPAIPPRVSLPWLLVAGLAWVGAIVFVQLSPVSPVPPGQMTAQGRVILGPIDGRFGPWALVETERAIVLLDLEETQTVLPGANVSFAGFADGKPGTARGRAYSAKVRVDEVIVDDGLSLSVLGESISGHVMTRLEPFDDGRGLLAGFLIGDTSNVSDSDVDAMRLSGLAHFVAVSGSNVALFLLLLFVATGPLAIGPKRRAVIGLIGLPVYAAATRFEPSVMRASLMAGIALSGRLVGVVLEAWQLLALAVVLLLLLDPHLSSNVGFQLSVVATAGVMVGARWPVKGGKLLRALAVTIGAQVAVAPLLLVHFGSVPLMSPAINLVAAPVVAASTVIGAVGVVGPGFLVDLASLLAKAVLVLARAGSTLPQLGPLGLGVLLGAGLIVLRWPRVAPAVALVGSVVVVGLLFGGRTTLPDGSVVVLDVGQGDSILIHGGDGRFALVDGGPDQRVLSEKLRRYGVRGLELVILTHVHADHVTGLIGVVESLPVSRVWADPEPHTTTAATKLFDLVSAEVPAVGDSYQLGSLSLEVLGPLRRYASPNDQSLVIQVSGSSRTMLLTGDIETVAQADLDHITADVLKVPHQGGATSDPDWLASVGASLAVVSVGPNQFGHPADWVVRELEEAGAEVVRTDQVGDVVVPLS